MSQYVSGKTIPRDNIMQFLSELFGVTTEYLSGSDLETENSNQAENKNEEESENDILNRQKGEVKMREFKKSTKLNNVELRC